VKVARTDTSASSLTMQGAVPEHAPSHPEKLSPDAATAVRPTDVPTGNVAEHESVQSIAAGLDRTSPLPAMLTLRVRVGAVTLPSPVGPPQPTTSTRATAAKDAARASAATTDACLLEVALEGPR